MAAARVLFIHSSPLIDLRNKPYVTDVDILNCSCEKKIIADTIRDSNLNVSFRSIIATVQNLSDAIIAGATMIHYAGHGERSAISFETKYAEIYAMDVKSLRSLLEASQTSSRTKIVVVSACHSEEAGKTFIEAGIPHVVAVRREHRLADRASHVFTKSFYNALLLNKSVQTAFDIAVSTISAIHGSNMGDEFILLPLNGNHSEIVFEDDILKEPITVTKNRTINFCDCPPSHFIERCRIMQEMFRHFVDNHRCVTLQGLRGSGKTALALRSAVYITERDLFDYIFYVPFDRVYDSSSDSKTKKNVDTSNNGAKYEKDTNANDTKNNVKKEALPMNSLINKIASSMRELGCEIKNLDQLLQFLTPDSRPRPRVLFIFDGCDVFLSKTGSAAAVITTPKLMTYKRVLQSNNNNNNNNTNNSNSNSNSNTNNNNNNNNNTNNNSSNRSNNNTPDNPLLDHTQSTTHPLFRELIDSMLRRSEDVSFLNVITANGQFLGLLSHEHEIIVTLPPLSEFDSAEFLLRISSPKYLKLPPIPSSIFPFSQMKFLGALQGNPRSIGTFALYLNNYGNSNNQNIPVRDTEFWINTAIEIHKKVTNECIEIVRNSDIKDNEDKMKIKNDKDKDKDMEKEKEKEKDKQPYDFSETPGYEGKMFLDNLKINFGLLSSQLPSASVMTSVTSSSAPIAFLSSPPLPRPLPPLCLNRSQAVANAFLLGVTSPSTMCRDDLIAHITLWAELTATRELPHTPKTFVKWSEFILKFEYLLFQIISVQYHIDPPKETVSITVKTENCDRQRHETTQTEIENMKNNFRRRLSSSDFEFLKQKIKLEFASKIGPKTSDSTLPSKSCMKNENTLENDQNSIVSLPAYKSFLSWWLPLLFALRKIKHEFCCHMKPFSTVRTVRAEDLGSDLESVSCPLVRGFVDRVDAVRLLETAQETGIFILRFSDSKPGQIAISYTDYVIYGNLEVAESDESYKKSDSSSLKKKEEDEGKRNKMVVGHCLVDTVVDGLVLRLSNTVRKYDTLKQLLLDCKKLKKFYPDIPKLNAFECLDNLQEYLQRSYISS